MRYLGLALYAEGPGDYRFLRPLLLRLCEDVCARSAKEAVEVGEVLALDDPPRFRNRAREERILEAARESASAWTVLFIHTDGASDPQRACAERIEPACRRIEAEIGVEGRSPVAVVPVREIEAWAMADGDALRAALGSALGNTALGVPDRARDVEAIPDPKRALTDALGASRHGRRPRRGGAASDMLGLLGERASLERLNQVPAFATLTADLRSALVGLRVVEEAP
jgi:hypothetical protein